VSARPTLRVERGLLRDGNHLLASMDEVGRGSLAGPVSVGVVVIDVDSRPAPDGVRDSKLLSPAQREVLVPAIRAWALASAVGHAEPEEIDEFGLTAALRLAGERALSQLPEPPDLVLLDGSHDWLTRPTVQGDLFADTTAAGDRWGLQAAPRVTTRVKADLTCASVAAASVLAKVERDGLMRVLGTQVPDYGWAFNMGYSSPEHVQALERIGPSQWHRRSWNLPGV
jgi:ribonuclease HII